MSRVYKDLYHGKPFGYQRTADGYLLYSFGLNGIDDGGSHEERLLFEGKATNGDDDVPDPKTGKTMWDQIPTGSDDLSLRVPIPVEAWPWE